MSRQDWIDLAWWMCFAGAMLVTIVLAHLVTIAAVAWLLI